MRQWMNLINEAVELAESVSFHPAEIRKEMWDGEEHTIIDYANGGIKRREEPCRFCEGTGKAEWDFPPNHKHAGKCGYCKGEGKTMEEYTDCPSMRVGYMEMATLRDVVGSGDPDHGWIPPEDVPALKQRLEKMLLGDIDTDHLTRPATDEQRPGQLNWDGSMTGGGPRMIGGPVTRAGLDAGLQRMLEIIDWAVEHKTGLSWA